MALLDRARPEAGLAVALCEEAAEVLGMDGASLVVMSTTTVAGAPGAVAAEARALVGAAGAATVDLDDAHLVTGEGPCLECHRTGRLVLVGDLGDRRARWPAFAARAAELDVGSIFAFPVRIGGISLGVLQVHRSSTGALDDEKLSAALRFVDAAAHVLLHDSGTAPWAVGEEQDLIDVTTPEVHQATGMVTVQAAVPLTEALLLLRSRAFTEGRPVREVSADVVARRLRFSPPGAA